DFSISVWPSVGRFFTPTPIRALRRATPDLRSCAGGQVRLFSGQRLERGHRLKSGRHAPVDLNGLPYPVDDPSDSRSLDLELIPDSASTLGSSSNLFRFGLLLDIGHGTLNYHVAVLYAHLRAGDALGNQLGFNLSQNRGVRYRLARGLRHLVHILSGPLAGL